MLIDYLDQMFRKLTRVWMYLLEMSGMSFYFWRMRLADEASKLLLTAKTPGEIARIHEYIDSITKTTDILMPYILILCVIMPAVIATMQTFRKKWSISILGNEITQEFATNNGEKKGYSDEEKTKPTESENSATQ
jgi:hypothetical protein